MENEEKEEKEGKEKVLHIEKEKEVKRLQDVTVENQDTTFEILKVREGQSKTGKATYYLETPDIVLMVWKGNRVGEMITQYADQIQGKPFTITIMRKSMKDGKPFYVIRKLAVKE